MSITTKRASSAPNKKSNTQDAQARITALRTQVDDHDQKLAESLHWYTAGEKLKQLEAVSFFTKGFITKVGSTMDTEEMSKQLPEALQLIFDLSYQSRHLHEIRVCEVSAHYEEKMLSPHLYEG